MADKLNIWDGYKHDASGKRTGKATVKEIRAAAAQSSKLTQAERDNRQAGRTTERMATPYRTAADAATADAARSMTNEQIAAFYGGRFDVASAGASLLGGIGANAAGNASSLLGGLVGALPGAGSYDVTGLLTGFTQQNAANADLSNKFSDSLVGEIALARDAGLTAAMGRRDERSDRLGKEARDFQLQGDVVASDTTTALSNILANRTSRQNLALAKLQMETQRLVNEKARNALSGSGSGSGTSGDGDKERPTVDTQSEKALLWFAKYGKPGTTITIPGWKDKNGKQVGQDWELEGGSYESSDRPSPTDRWK